MRILFRTDCNRKIGSGHFSRSYILSKSLKKFNNKIFFLSINYEKDFSYKKKIKNLITKKINKYTQKKDLDLTLSVIRNKKIDLLILDNYKLGNRWCESIKKKVKKFVIIDDGFKKDFDCDLYINNTNPKKEIVSTRPELIGLDYFFINKDYLNLKNVKLKYDLFINFGTGNFNFEIKRLLFIINKLDPIKHIVLVGKNKKITQKIRKKLRYKITLVDKFKNLAPLINKSKLCIGAGGLNLLERVYLRKSNITFSCADHQKTMSVYLSKKKVIEYLGDIKKLKKSNIDNILKKKISFYLNNKSMNKKIIDSNGAIRTAKKINNLSK